MLAVAKIAPGRHRYYLQTAASVARNAAPAAGAEGLVEADGRWLGRGSERLGIEGDVVSADALASVLAGVHPLDCGALDPAHRRVRVAAFDCTFAPAKSVSLLHALAPPELGREVGLAHDAAVRDVLAYLDRNAAFVRRSQGGARELHAATGLVAAGFVHRTSRGNDPHLHTHVVIANLAEDRDGRWSALDGRPMYLHASTASLLYAAALRHELDLRVGLRFSSPHPYADLSGVDRRVVEAFSTRRRDIEEELALIGRERPGARALAARRTRPAKDLATPYAALMQEWQARAERLGISGERLARLACPRGARREPARARSEPEGRRAADPIGVNAGGPFTRRDLLRQACVDSLRAPLSPVDATRRVGFAATVEAAADAVLASAELVVLGRDATGGLRGRGGTRIPSGVVETRYAPPEWVALVARREAALVESTRRLGDLGDGPLGAVASAYRDAAQRGRAVAAYAPDARLAAHFEGMTGLPTTVLAPGASPDRFVPAGSRLAVVGARRLDAAHLRGLFALAREGVEIDFLDRPGFGNLEPGATPVHASRTRVGAVEVVVAPSPGSVLAALHTRLEEAKALGAAPVVVVAGTELAARLGGVLSHDVVVAGRLGPFLRGDAASSAGHVRQGSDPEPALLVLGPAGLLSSRGRLYDDAKRTHLVVAPLAAPAHDSARLGWFAGVAQPRHLRTVLGALPTALEPAASWRRAAACIESYRARHGVNDLGDAWGTTPLDAQRRSDLLAVRAELRSVLGRDVHSRVEPRPEITRDAQAMRPTRVAAPPQRERPGPSGLSR